jgi:hypothetical protein
MDGQDEINRIFAAPAKVRFLTFKTLLLKQDLIFDV